MAGVRRISVRCAPLLPSYHRNRRGGRLSEMFLGFAPWRPRRPNRKRGISIMENHDPSGAWIQENRSTWDERAAIHMRDEKGFYALDRFRAGEDVLMAIEAAEIGDVRGKHVLHLQCHIGLDTLCLARRGATVT